MDPSRELRVFISSTFRDLQEERNHLSKKIFPAIRSICRERGVEFTEIDLRWGLTDEEAHNGLVIRSCLEEIDRCRPYFIGIVGSRYGWIPEHHIIQRDPELLRRYPWIEDAANEGKSIIEMEFNYGALNDPAAASCAYFYLSHHLRPEDSDNPELLEALKDRIRTSGLPCREYKSAASLGDHIYNDLVRIIDERWPAASEISPLDRERKQHDAFAANRRHAYIAHPENIQQLTHYAKGNSHVPLVITAPSGAGKSALLAYWSDFFDRRNPNVCVIEHYIGVSSRGNDEHAVLSHIVEELKAQFDLDTPIPQTSAERIADFPLWLSRAQGKPVIIVVDALNQLDDTPQRLAWIPEHLPENVKLIVSTTDPAMFDFASQHFERLELAPLTISEREAIIVRFLGEYHKSLPSNETLLIANDLKSERPLFLRTLLEEIRLFGSHEVLVERVREYLQCADLAALFQLVLERMEEDYGPHVVRDVMTAIWATRHGLTEHELGELVHATPSHLSVVLLALDYHLIKRENRFAFFHEYLRSAVEARYLSQAEKKKKAHAHFGEYLAVHASVGRRIEEEAWQWQQAEDWGRLRDTLVNPTLFPLLASKDHQYELLGYWRALKGTYDIAAEYERAIEQREAVREHIPVLALLAGFYSVSGLYDAAERVYRQMLVLGSQQAIPPLELAAIEEQFAETMYHKSRYEEAAALYKQAVAIYSTHQGEHARSTLNALNGYGLALLKEDRTKAIQTLEYCLATYHEQYGEHASDIIPMMLNLALGYYRIDEFAKAIQLMHETVAHIEKLNGSESAALIVPLTNLGAMLRKIGDHQGALGCYERALALSSKFLGRHHHFSLTSYYNMGIVYFFEGQYERYLTIIREVFDERLRRFGIGHDQTLLVLSWLCQESYRHPTLAATALELWEKANTGVSNNDIAEKLRAMRTQIKL